MRTVFTLQHDIAGKDYRLFLRAALERFPMFMLVGRHPSSYNESARMIRGDLGHCNGGIGAAAVGRALWCIKAGPTSIFTVSTSERWTCWSDLVHCSAATFEIIRMHRATLSMLLGSALSLSIGCDRQTASLSQQHICVCGATNWVTAELHGFSVLMPSQPSTSVITNETTLGPLVISMTTSEVSPTVLFRIVHNSIPTNLPVTDTEGLLSAGLKQVLGADGHLISKRAVSINGSPGTELRFNRFQGQAVITMRIYLVGHEFYQATSFMPRGRVCQRHVSEFLGSCQLKSR